MRGSADNSLKRLLEAHQHHRTCSCNGCCKQVRKMRSTHSSRHSPSEARSAPQLDLTKFGLGGRRQPPMNAGLMAGSLACTLLLSISMIRLRAEARAMGE